MAWHGRGEGWGRGGRGGGVLNATRGIEDVVFCFILFHFMAETGEERREGRKGEEEWGEGHL